MAYAGRILYIFMDHLGISFWAQQNNSCSYLCIVQFENLKSRMFINKSLHIHQGCFYVSDLATALAAVTLFSGCPTVLRYDSERSETPWGNLFKFLAQTSISAHGWTDFLFVGQRSSLHTLIRTHFQYERMTWHLKVKWLTLLWHHYVMQNAFLAII